MIWQRLLVLSMRHRGGTPAPWRACCIVYRDRSENRDGRYCVRRPGRRAASRPPSGVQPAKKGGEMRLLILVACSLILACLPAAAATADPKGIWLVEDKSAQIDIENCSGVLWGIVIWERTAGRDNQNPDPALRGRPTLGIPILLGMKPTAQQGSSGPQTVWRGQIYNAR